MGTALEIIGTVAIVTIATIALTRELRQREHRRGARGRRSGRRYHLGSPSDLACSNLFGEIRDTVRAGDDAGDLLLIYEERCVRA